MGIGELFDGYVDPALSHALPTIPHGNTRGCSVRLAAPGSLQVVGVQQLVRRPQRSLAVDFLHSLLECGAHLAEDDA